ncbi:metalloregulator ArsR/SmtB family transcription factor [Sporosarcina sp. ACRSL]|uniref:ArsR/SmtB family transcription factor n=1 Tax=Sporosarcina sp. ACRSL TaxID=2918215 RepID=UPI001EF672E4|nr:metalloregulator ArsR/SmtB family transcription factor [Sporosarcina sp. ACRSL]MCG7343659.1 metalloregulator ArsR/SmtB family transcription factor [Sporosarcina sp. ACRSL]
MTDIYRAIADPTRRKILTLLSRNEYTQSELVDRFTISQPAVKKHLEILVEEDLVAERKEGRYRVYSLKRDNFKHQYEKLQQEIGSVLDNKLMNLKKYLEGESDGESH